MQTIQERVGDSSRTRAMWRFEQKRGFWARTGISAETVYWAIFTAGLLVLGLLIMEILASLAG